MKLSSRSVIFTGLVCLACVKAQGQPSAQGGTPPPAFQGTISVSSGTLTITGGSGAITFGGGPTAVYGSGAYPNLEGALTALYAAQLDLGNANPAAKGDYLPRALLGVQYAIADVKLAVDNADGAPPPPASALSTLPAGVGNVSSGLVVELTKTLTTASPNMDAANADLTTALHYLRNTTPGNKGIYLHRAIADVNFALDNANAATNLANGAPASHPRGVAASPSPLAGLPPATSVWGFSFEEIGGAFLVVFVLTAIIAEQLWRARGRR